MWGDGGAYGTWTAFLERWQKDLQSAEIALPSVAQADFALDTWIRLQNRIIDAINGRLQLWADALTADISHAASEFAVGRALTQARVGLGRILALADYAGLPADLREQLTGAVDRQIRSLQISLEESVTRPSSPIASRAVIEARLRTVRDNALTATLTTSSEQRPGTRPDPWAFDPTRPARRTFAID